MKTRQTILTVVFALVAAGIVLYLGATVITVLILNSPDTGLNTFVQRLEQRDEFEVTNDPAAKEGAATVTISTDLPPSVARRHVAMVYRRVTTSGEDRLPRVYWSGTANGTRVGGTITSREVEALIADRVTTAQYVQLATDSADVGRFDTDDHRTSPACQRQTVSTAGNTTTTAGTPTPVETPTVCG